MKMRLGLLLALMLLIPMTGCPTASPPIDEGTATDGAGAAEGTEEDDDGELAAIEGKIDIDGSSTVYLISEAMQVAFNKQYPNVKIPIGKSGTGAGFKRFVVGGIDVSNASRPISPDEFNQCKANNVSFVEVAVAYDGLSVVVNNENDWCDQLTVAELQKIFIDGPEKAMKWSDVRAGWPDLDIELFIPGTESGTFDYFKEVLIGKDESKAIRSDVSSSEDDNTLVTGVSKEKGALGFFGCAYYFESKDKLRAVPIVNAAGKAVSPTPETIESGEYNPLSRPLFVYVNADRLQRPEVKMYVDFLLDNTAEISTQVGYVALPAAVYETARDFVSNRRTGTSFVTPEGEKRSGSIVELYKAENLNSSAK